ncbi:MAG: trigger factor [Solirubrobacteraceae bacterium]
MSTLSTTITELPESRVRVDAEVPAGELERRLGQAARKLGGQLRIPGFRKGKVPPQVVIRRLGRDAVFDEALRSALGEWYLAAIDDSGISPVGEPDFKFADEIPEQGQPLSFSIEIGVRPQAKLGDYRGLEVGRREPAVAEAEIDEEIERLRDRLAKLDTVQRPAEQGDHVVIDYAGSLDPVKDAAELPEGGPFAGGEGRDQMIELGSGRLIPGFEDQLVGASAGEQLTIKVTFPDDYGAELGGRAASFEVSISEVKAKRLPELDDDFAAEASEFDTLQELRSDIAERLGHADEHAIEHEFEQAVLQAAADGAELELPDRLVHARAHEMLEQTFSALARQGISKDAYLRIAGRDEEEMAREAEPEAAAALRREAVLAAVVAAERIEPTDDDLLEALAPAAERDGADPAELLARLRKAGRVEELREDLAARRALELMVAEATPISVEQAQAREKLWTPGKEGAGAAAGSSGQLWTPGD